MKKLALAVIAATLLSTAVIVFAEGGGGPVVQPLCPDGEGRTSTVCTPAP